MMSRKTLLIHNCLTAGLALLATAGPAEAWHGKGHQKATLLAVSALPRDMPAFFRQGAAQIAHGSEDPDLFRLPGGHVKAAERPEHYCDLEVLGGMSLPAGRYELVVWCVKKDIPIAHVGFAPYAATEWTQRLSVAFAEHRAWPGNEHIRQKTLVYAGLLAHYAQDLCQPLHTTIHHDGRAGKDGVSPQTGIHLKVDALLEKVPDSALATLDANAVRPFEKLFDGVVAEVTATHALVDRTYELEKLLPAKADPFPAAGPVAGFARERLKAAALFTARLYVTAWRDSAAIELPPWHEREAKAADRPDKAAE